MEVVHARITLRRTLRIVLDMNAGHPCPWDRVELHAYCLDHRAGSGFPNACDADERYAPNSFAPDPL